MIVTSAATLPRISLRTIAVVMILAIAAGPSLAALPTGSSSARRPAVPHRASILDVARRIDANRVNMFTTNYGSFAWDIGGPGSPPGLIYPKGTSKTAVFAAGLWLAATVAGEERTVVSEYSQEYGPGAMVGGTFDDPYRPEYVVYKVARWTGDPADSEHVNRSPAELAADPLLDPLLHHSWSEYIAGAKPFGAPTRIYRLPDTSTPQPDDSVDVEGPDVIGDQMLWEVHNDADPSRHTNVAGSSTPLGVEIQQTTFAYDRPDVFGDIVFFRFRIANRGANTLDDLYVSLWSDPDVGGAADDLVGCDVPFDMGYAFNATNNDFLYGSQPPAVGFVLLQGVKTALGNTLGMTGFSKYINGTDPASTSEAYNTMRGLLPDGNVVIDPTNGNPTNYFHPGDPVTGSGWIDSQPADRRMNVSSGPGRMLPGESQEIWAALVVGQGQHRLASITAARCLAAVAKDAFLVGFSSLPPVPATCQTGPPDVANCPKPAAFWGLECADGGLGQLSAQEIAQAAAFVDNQSTLFDWLNDPSAGLCGTVSPPEPPDARQRARSEFATFLANLAGSTNDLILDNGQRLFLDPSTPISCPPLTATTIGELASTAVLAPGLTAHYLNDNPTNPTALEGVNFGLAAFGGGADVGFNFFGSTLDPATMPDSFTTVEIRFDQTAPQKAYRFVRLQTTTGSAPAAYPDRGYLNRGFIDVPFQVWDVASNAQLDAAFVEREATDDAGVRLPEPDQPPSADSTWAPTADADGGREYLFVYRRPYSPTPKAELAVDGSVLAGIVPVLFVAAPKLINEGAVIDDGDRFEFRWGLPAGPGADQALIELESQPLSDPEVVAAYQAITDCLSGINAGIGIGVICDDPTPTLVSLVSAEAGPDRITLRWYCAEAGLSVSVERRAAAEGWAVIGRVVPDGSGMLVFEDRDVTAGGIYDYRLAVGSGEHVEYLGETRVEIPYGTTLAFLGTRSSPGDGRVLLAYSLGTREPARLELMDVAGRRLFARDLTGMAPGVHTLALEDHVRLPAGIYLVRIRQGALRAAGKAAIVR